jgi:hypothetical protein
MVSAFYVAFLLGWLGLGALVFCIISGLIFIGLLLKRELRPFLTRGSSSPEQGLGVRKSLVIFGRSFLVTAVCWGTALALIALFHP